MTRRLSRTATATFFNPTHTMTKSCSTASCRAKGLRRARRLTSLKAWRTFDHLGRALYDAKPVEMGNVGLCTRRI